MSGFWYRAPNSLHRQGLEVRLLRRVLLAVGSLLTSAGTLLAVTPESPEVRELVDKGLEYLEKHNDSRLGGKCLVALAFLKNGVSNNHPRVQEALKACEQKQAGDIRQDDVYSNGLAIIFLAELDPGKHRELLKRYADVMEARQKPHGGWGYEGSSTGDTSQTQYAVLSYWQLMQAGQKPSVKSVEDAANWLLRTQDPNGGWGYQGEDPGTFELKPQTRVSLSMVSAGLGSMLMCANVLGTIDPGQALDAPEQQIAESLPSALRVAEGPQVQKIRTLSGGNLDRSRVLKAISNGQKKFNASFGEFTQAEYPFYVLYSIERYKSFEEYLSGNTEEVPDWYQQGFKFIKEKQAQDGSWTSPSEAPSATAFAILFLVRSTQKSIKSHLGTGTLVGGRGLSANLARMKLKQGRLVTERTPTDVDKLLAMVEDSGGASLDALLSDTATLDVENIGPDEIRRLEELLKTGSPEARLLAVEGLGKLRDLDHVPSLLYALTDPDKRVVRAARDGLKYVSRRFDGYGPPDNYTETERYDALEKWKNWYRRLRPNALQLPR
jgi:hypothetical protein